MELVFGGGTFSCNHRRWWPPLVARGEVAPGKLGDGGSDEHLTTRVTETIGWNPAGTLCSLPGKGWSPTGNESCVVGGRPSLRSVDSECVGRVIEPRKLVHVGADVFLTTEGNSDVRQQPRNVTPIGVLVRGTHTRIPQEPGRSARFRLHIPAYGHRVNKGQNSSPARGLARGNGCEQATPASGTAERTKGSEVGRSSRSRSAFTVALKRGNRPEGPRGARGGTGAQHRVRERWP
jgi:hypothetical protein